MELTASRADFLRNGLILILSVGTVLTLNFFLLNAQKQKNVRELVALPRGIEHFTWGHKDALADFGWVRVIQDFDYCEAKDSNKECRGNGWLAQMLDVITELAPDFRAPYSQGGVALSILISDRKGATHIFEKGVSRISNDWVLDYKAAYHFLYEENAPERAALLMERAAKNGAPVWVYALASRLYSKAGKAELALRLYNELAASQNIPDDVLVRMKERLQEAGVSLTTSTGITNFKESEN